MWRSWMMLLTLLALGCGTARAEKCPPQLVSGAAAADGAASAPVRQLYVRDGQLLSWDFRLHVAPDLPPGVKPKLCLFTGHLVTEASAAEQEMREPRLLAYGQKFTGGAAEEGADTSQVGTLMHFAPLSGLMPWWKPMMRVRPVITWTEADGKTVAVVAPRAVNLGHAPTAWAISGAAALLFLGILWVIARNSRMKAISLVQADDGHLSLSLLQMALWTLVVGMVVMYFAIVQLQVPEIPTQLVVLMGMSLVTTGISYAKTERTNVAGPNENWSLADLIEDSDGGGLSLSRAQMLFWTLLLIAVFVGKSMLTAELWAIPWELVALMGISQAGYVAPKVAPPKPAADAPTPDAADPK